MISKFWEGNKKGKKIVKGEQNMENNFFGNRKQENKISLDLF